MTGYSRAEQETTVRWDRESDVLTLFTHSERDAKRLIKQGATVLYTSAGGKAWGLQAPREWFRWPRPKRAGGKGNAEALQKARQERKLAQNALTNQGESEGSGGA